MSEGNGLPEGWARGTLGAVADLNMGQSPPGSATNTEGVGVPLVGGAADLKAIHPTPSKHTSAATKLCVENDIILCIRATIGRTAIADREYCLGRGVAGLTARAVQRDWLRHYMSAAEQQLMDLGTGTTFKQVSKDTLTHFEVPVAPLNEQRRIVTKIEKLQERSDAAKEALDAIPPLLEKFRQSVLAAAFRGDLTKDWRAKNPDVEPASVLLERIRKERKARFIEDAAEKARAKAEAKATEAGKPWTDEDTQKVLVKERVKAEKKYKAPDPVDTTDLTELPEGWCWASGAWLFEWASGKNLPKSKMKSGDVPVYGGNGVSGEHDVANCSDPTLVVGRVGANCGNAHSTAGPAWITDNAIFACGVSSLIGVEFAVRYFRSIDLRSQARGGGQPFVSQKTLNDLLIPVPPLAEQAAIIEVVIESIDTVTTTRRGVGRLGDELSRLNQSILAKAFRGELVPQDPSDEPASALLERIRAERAQAEAEKKAAKAAARKAARKSG